MSRRIGGGTLFPLILLLLASAALRVGIGVGQAIAAGADPAPDSPEATAPLDCPAPPLALAQALHDREKRAEIREIALAERIAALDLSESLIQQRLQELGAAEDRLRATLSLADEAAEKDLTQLTEVYQAMKPKEAARLFDGMDPQFSAGFLGRMRPKEAAAILAGMSEERAYAASALLAGRNADVPTE